VLGWIVSEETPAVNPSNNNKGEVDVLSHTTTEQVVALNHKTTIEEVDVLSHTTTEQVVALNHKTT
jgi:hypothetical protein